MKRALILLTTLLSTTYPVDNEDAIFEESENINLTDHPKEESTEEEDAD